MNKLFLILISLGLNLINVDGQTTETAYLVRVWNHNKELQNNTEKQEAVIREIKNKILTSPLFIYSIILDKHHLILISQDDNIDGSIIQKIFEPYLIKTNIIERKKIVNTSINLLGVPICNPQNPNNYKNKLLVWESENTESIYAIKTLFTLK